jgi:hypothetical protein
MRHVTNSASEQNYKCNSSDCTAYRAIYYENREIHRFYDLDGDIAEELTVSYDAVGSRQEGMRRRIAEQVLETRSYFEIAWEVRFA